MTAMLPMLKTLLADRFKLKVHRDQRPGRSLLSKSW